MSTNNWFSVDKDGLRKLVDERGKVFVLHELLQNAWDTDATEVRVTIEKLPGRPFARLEVKDDDPEGFHDLSHAYTLFAESRKKADPTKRGRFNLGEKLVLALCRSASVRSTKGMVLFNEDGTLNRSRRGATEAGSIFEAEIRMNAAEYDEVCEAMGRLLPPRKMATYFNEQRIESMASDSIIAMLEATLPTVIANSEGTLTKTKRKTTVLIYDAHGEPGWIYEMGIPVVETGDTYHVDIMQKVPLTMDRDNVPPSYLTLIRACVLNHVAHRITPAVAAEAWVTNALESRDIEPNAVKTAVEKRFGKKRAIWDPSDREANMNLTAQGYTVISGGSLPRAAWENIKSAEAALPAGQIAPTPKPFGDGDEMKIIERDDWTTGMKEVAEICEWWGRELDVPIADIVFGLPKQRHWAAAWSSGSNVLTFNVSSLGRYWIEGWREHPVALLDLLIHELAHSKALNHLDDGFHKACTYIGAKMAVRCMRGPTVLNRPGMLDD